MKHILNKRLLFISTFLISSLACFTIKAQTPGGISTGLQVWLKANAGTTTAGVNLTAWQDQSPAATAVTVNGSPDFTNPGYNYNPYINFTMSSGTGGDFLHIPNTNFQSFFWVAQLANLNRPSTHMATYDGVTLGQPCNGCPIHGGANGGGVAEYHEFGYGTSNFQAAGVWRKNGNPTGIAYNTPHSGKFDIVTALGAAPVPTNVFMGGQNSNFPVFDGRVRDWLGPVGEIIAYTGAITAAQANKVESYLAVKYGITLGGNGSTTLFYTAPNGTTIWAANTGYHYDVAGIGNDNVIEALNQPKSHSINIPADAVIMANGNFAVPTALADGQYLLWGHNNGPLTYTCQNITHAGPSTTVNAVWGRTWRTQKTGTPAGNVVVAMDMSMFQGPSGMGTTNNADVRLLIDDNTNFTDGSVGEHTYVPDAGFAATSGQITFTVPATDFQNGVGYFKLALITTPTNVIIAATDTVICAGTSVTFTATPINGGTSPTYQWQVNGANVGTNSNTFTTSTLNNNDLVYLILTSNATCVSPNTAISHIFTMQVSPATVPTISISTPTTTICAGTPVTFTAVTTNVGAAATIQWQVNNVNVGTNSNTFTSSTLTNNDNVTAILTANQACILPASLTSNPITMTANAALIPSVTISASSTTICPGSSITFTAIPTNGGTTPTYQWQINGVNAGTNSTLVTSALSNNDSVRLILTSNATCVLPTTAISNVIGITTNATPVPSVSISATATTICAGTSVTFTAVPTNGGTLPTYQWQVNGVNVGSDSTGFTSATLTNNASVTVILTSNAACVSPATDTSNAIVVTVNPIVSPSVIISTLTTTICTGTLVTFTAVPTNGGASPTYQWQLNGVNVGTNSATYSSTTLNNNDSVRVILTSNALCVSTNIANSNVIGITVDPTIIPSVTISASPTPTTICAGAPVTFTAVPTNGGVNPIFQWQVNNVNVGGNINPFTSSTLNNNDSVRVILTSNANCVSPATANSNSITITVNPIIIPTVTASASSTTICAGTLVNFTATPTNGGTTPTYQWQVNGVTVLTNSLTFSSTTLNNGDDVTFTLISNATCASPTTLTTVGITMIVNPILSPSVTIVASSTSICAGTPVTFTATPINGGASPTYQWSVNGVNVGANSASASFTSSTLSNNDAVSVVLTSNAPCLSIPTATVTPITITVNPTVIPSVTVVPSATSICSGASVSFIASAINGGTNPIYQWKVNGTNVGTNSPTFTSTTLNNSDIVTVTLTSNANCALPTTVVSTGISMNVTPQPDAAFDYTPSVIDELNPDVQFINNSLNSTSWLWNFGLGNSSVLQNPFYTFPGAGTYLILLTAYNGLCVDTISRILEVTSLSTYYIPNAFTPNGDGTNDVFNLKGTGISKDNFEMSIFNRWGELIFETNDIKVGWDGRTKAQLPAQEEVYIYVINFELNSDGGTKLSKTGKITLVR